MATVSLQDAQALLPELIRRLGPGEELVITDNTQPIAKLVATKAERIAPRLGTLAKSIVYIADDFDAPLDDFREYMQ